MDKDFLKEVDSLFDNNKELIDRLTEEKRLLESLFLDNRIPEEFKQTIMAPYNALVEVVDRRVDIYKALKQAKKEPNLVGFLYNETQQKYMKSIIKKLQELSERRNVKIICFKLGSVNLKEGLVEGVVIEPSSITNRRVSIPECTFNIGYYSKPENINRVKQMYMLYGSIVVNPVNIFNQAVVFDVLSAAPAVKECILPVSTLSPSIILEYLESSNTLFLLPERGLRNNAAIRIEKHPKNKRNLFSILSGGSRQFCGEKNLYMYIKKMIAGKRYLVVQGQKALLWNGTPLEARVYVQKGITGKWNVTQMIGKNEIFVKDSIYKDTADELDRTLLSIKPEKTGDIMQQLENYSTNICSLLDYYFSYLGSCIADFIISEDGTPFLLAFGGWDQKDYLFKLNGKHIWDKYLSNSVDYLLYLQQIKRQGG
jgi:hypothetical protein